MKPKLILILALVVLSPLAVILWLGARVVQDEQYAVERRIRQLVTAELNGVADSLDRAAADYEQLVLDTLLPPSVEAEELRRRAREAMKTAVELYERDGKSND